MSLYHCYYGLVPETALRETVSAIFTPVPPTFLFTIHRICKPGRVALLPFPFPTSVSLRPSIIHESILLFIRVTRELYRGKLYARAHPSVIISLAPTSHQLPLLPRYEAVVKRSGSKKKKKNFSTNSPTCSPSFEFRISTRREQKGWGRSSNVPIVNRSLEESRARKIGHDRASRNLESKRRWPPLCPREGHFIESA